MTFIIHTTSGYWEKVTNTDLETMLKILHYLTGEEPKRFTGRYIEATSGYQAKQYWFHMFDDCDRVRFMEVGWGTVADTLQVSQQTPNRTTRAGVTHTTDRDTPDVIKTYINAMKS